MAFAGRWVSYIVIVVTGFATGAEPDEAVPKKKPLDIESVYYAQQVLLRAALDRVRFSSDDLAEIYFVGFAPDAAEDVFESEVKHVEALFREKTRRGGSHGVAHQQPQHSRRTAAGQRSEPRRRT